MLLIACSRPVAIAPDNAPPTKDAGPPPAPSTKYFMDTSSGSKECYRDVWCKILSEKCPELDSNGVYDDAWTKKTRALHTGAWCCYSSETCEFPAP